MSRRNGCNGKKRHPTQAGAIIHARRLRDHGLDTYRCTICKHWHVGHSNKPWKVQARISQLLAKGA